MACSCSWGGRNKLTGCCEKGWLARASSLTSKSFGLVTSLTSKKKATLQKKISVFILPAEEVQAAEWEDEEGDGGAAGEQEWDHCRPAHPGTGKRIRMRRTVRFSTFRINQCSKKGRLKIFVNDMSPRCSGWRKTWNSFRWRNEPCSARRRRLAHRLFQADRVVAFRRSGKNKLETFS